MKYPIGVSIIDSKRLKLESLLELKRAGVDAIEISISDIPYSQFDFAKLKKDADQAGVDLWSMHCQFTPEDSLSACDNELNRRWLERTKETINRAAAVGIDKIIIHTCDRSVSEDRAGCMQHAMEYLDKIVEYALPKDFYIALENLPRDCLGNTPEEFMKMLECNPNLKVCFDFNHCLLTPTDEFVKKVGERVITVHVSDRDDINERHWMPGEGVLDWVKIMDAFDTINYKGVWLYEVGFEAGGTIERPVLKCEDYVNNAKALFARKQPVVLGTPKPNLGMWGPEE